MLARRDFDQRRREAAPRRIAHRMNVATGFEHLARQFVQSGRVTLERALELKSFTRATGSRRHDRRSGPTGGSRRRGGRCASDRLIPGGTTPMPDVLIKILSPLPRPTTLVSPVTI